MGRAELLCHRQTVVLEIGGHDELHWGRLEDLHQHQADEARAEHDDDVLGREGSEAPGVDRHRHGLDHRRLLVGHARREAVDDMGRHCHQLREGTVLPVVLAGDAEHAPVVAQVHEAAAREEALRVVDGRVHGHAVARAHGGDPGADPLDDPRRLVPHHDRRPAAARAAVQPVHVASADAAGHHAHEDVARAHRGLGTLLHLELTVRLEHQRLHGAPYYHVRRPLRHRAGARHGRDRR